MAVEEPMRRRSITLRPTIRKHEGVVRVRTCTTPGQVTAGKFRFNLSSQQLQCRPILALHLLQGAVSGILVRPPSQKFSAMAKSSAGEMIKPHLYD